MTTATADAGTFKLTHDQLMALSAGPDSYRFLALGLLALPQIPDDVQLRLQLIRHLATLGLIGPAAEIAADMPDEIHSQLAAAGVFRQFESVPSGRVPWEQLRERFEANLRVLSQRYPDVRQIDAEWHAHRGRLELYQCRDGNWQVSTRDRAGRRIWLPRLLDHKAESERTEIPGLPGALFLPPYLVKGLGLGWYFQRLVEATRKRFLNYSPTIYVLGPSLLEMAVVLHLHDWRELLADPRVYFFLGSDCGEQFVSLLSQDTNLPIPRQNVGILSIAAGAEIDTDALVERVAGNFSNRHQALFEKVDRLYAPYDAAWWAERYSRNDRDDPLRIYFMVSRHTTYLQYCIRDLASAFERRGMQTRILMERDDHSQLSMITCLENIRSFRPDMFFVIDHFRYEYARSLPANLPYVGWIQDQLANLYSRQCGESLGPMDFFIATEPAVFVGQYGYPASQGMAWTMATDDRVYSADPLPEDELAEHRCDFSFVSNQSTPPARFHEDRRRQFAADPEALRMVDRLYGELAQSFREQPDVARMSVQWMIERIEEREGPQPVSDHSRHAILRYYLDQLAELMFRQQTLEWVADYCDRTGRTLHLHGNGWQDHPRFARYARGIAANGRHLRAIYQASAINLQIIATGAVHQRLLDGLASGGFFLIRFTPPDTSHEAVRRHLEALRKYRPAADTDYDAADMPEVAETQRELHRIMGHDLRNERFRINAGDQAMYEGLEADGFRRVAGAIFPEYPGVAFKSAAEFDGMADRFLADPGRRGRIAGSMRKTVIERYGYDVLIDELLKFVTRRLKDVSANAGN